MFHLSIFRRWCVVTNYTLNFKFHLKFQHISPVDGWNVQRSKRCEFNFIGLMSPLEFWYSFTNYFFSFIKSIQAGLTSGLHFSRVFWRWVEIYPVFCSGLCFRILRSVHSCLFSVTTILASSQAWTYLSCIAPETSCPNLLSYNTRHGHLAVM